MSKKQTHQTCWNHPCFFLVGRCPRSNKNLRNLNAAWHGQCCHMSLHTSEFAHVSTACLLPWNWMMDATWLKNQQGLGQRWGNSTFWELQWDLSAQRHGVNLANCANWFVVLAYYSAVCGLAWEPGWVGQWLQWLVVCHCCKACKAFRSNDSMKVSNLLWHGNWADTGGGIALDCVRHCFRNRLVVWASGLAVDQQGPKRCALSANELLK